MIDRTTLLQTLGGFAPYKSDVAAEASIAAKLGTHAYHCLVGTTSLGVTYEKKWLSQLETSRRLFYPMVGGRISGAIAGLLFFAVLNAPTAIVAYGIVTSHFFLAAVAGAYLVAFMCLYGMYTNVVWQRDWWLGVLCWPIVIAQELILLMSSTWGYLRHTVTWKGRLLTAPVLRADHIKIDE